VVPMRVGEKNGAERFRVVADGAELVCGGLPEAEGGHRAKYPRNGLNPLMDMAAETGVDQEVALRVLPQSAGHAEVAAVEERAAAIAVGGDAMVHTGHQGEDGQLFWRRGGGQRARVGRRHRQRRRGKCVQEEREGYEDHCCSGRDVEALAFHF
jgi:hypothetical protein